MPEVNDVTRFAIQTRQGYVSPSHDGFVQDISELDPNQDLLTWDQCSDVIFNFMEEIQSDAGFWFRVETIVPWPGNPIDPTDSRIQ